MFCSSMSLFCFLFAACLVGCSCAKPKPRESDSSYNITSMIAKTIQSFPQDLEWTAETIMNFPRNMEWGDISMGLLDDDHEFPLNSARVMLGMLQGFIIRFEMLLMADEKEPAHWQFPVQEAYMEKDHRVIATAVTQMWMDLSTMEETNNILESVSENVILETLKRTDTNDPFLIFPALTMKTDLEREELLLLMQVMFYNLDKAIMYNDRLRFVYNTNKVKAELKASVATQISPPILNRAGVSKWNLKVDLMEVVKRPNRPLVLQAICNKLFIAAASKDRKMIYSQDRFDKYVMARSVLELASKPGCKEAVNQLYREAVAETAATFSVKFFAKTANVKIATEYLFNAIRTKFEKNYRLNIQLKIVKTKLDKNTVFFSDTFCMYKLPL